MVSGRDPKTGAASCPLDVTTEATYERDRLGLDDEELADVKALRTPGLPNRSETTLTVQLLPAGVAPARAGRGLSLIPLCRRRRAI